MGHVHLVETEGNLRGTINQTEQGCKRRETATHVVTKGIAQDVVKCFRLGDILRGLPDDDGELDFVVYTELIT